MADMAYIKNNTMLVAAIDFGTTYSGWAYSLRHDYKVDPTRISVKQWNSGRNISLKAPTTVLIKPDGKTIEAFGYEAEEYYKYLIEENKHHSYFYFQRFKMMLYRKKNLTRKTMIDDETGQSLQAMTVFSLAIRYLKEDLMETCRKRLTGDLFSDKDVHWVLTVPAIWNDSAKQFMRESANKAGIIDEHLTVALEPEAASIFCRLVPVDQVKKTEDEMVISTFRPGSKYMVIDAGGGTVDINIHEVLEGGKLKELHKASGGAYGGIKVDEAFESMLIVLFGKVTWNRFQKECIEDLLEMMRDFEVKKREISPSKSIKITLRIPPALRDIYKEECGLDWKESMQQTYKAEEVNLVGDKLRIDSSMYKALFDKPIDDIVQHVKTLIKLLKLDGLNTILMVGGFSESPMLENALKLNFPDLKLIIPENAGLAVIKGAVVYGHDPSGISERVCRFSYGIETNAIFDNEKHDAARKFRSNEEWLCQGAFDKHVEKGQTVTYGVYQAERGYTPTTADQTTISVDIYEARNKYIQYVDQIGCTLLGNVRMKLCDMSVPLRERKLSVSFSFSGTEIEVKVVEKRTGLVTKARVDFLE